MNSASLTCDEFVQKWCSMVANGSRGSVLGAAGDW